MIWIATVILETLVIVTTQQEDGSNKRLLTSNYALPCKDECGLRGESYYWCNTDKGWDFCSTTFTDKRLLTSYYGIPCNDGCNPRRGSYYYCHTDKGWDYCSPSFNVDYENNTCKNDSLCGRYNKKYNWCYLEVGSWGYCSREPKVLSHRTIKGVQCVDDCLYFYSEGYYCYTSDSWDYCSILPEMTYNNKECQEECEIKGKYYKCKTGLFFSDYCGPIEKGECEYKQPTTKKRARPKKQPVCKPSSTDITEINLSFRESDMHGLTANLRREVTDIIQSMDIGDLHRGGAGTIISTPNFRVDLQGTFQRDRRFYRNLQIQLNTRRSGQSTTVAQVELPVMQNNDPTIPDEQVRLAFQMSFQRQGIITIGFLNRRSGRDLYTSMLIRSLRENRGI